MKFLSSPFYKCLVFVLGFVVTPLAAWVANHWYLDGRMTPVFEKITSYAWMDLTLTGGFPIFGLAIWFFLTDYIPALKRSWPHRRAHLLAGALTVPVIFFLSIWSQSVIWQSTEPDAGERFILAPFATLSLAVVFYFVAYSLLFRMGPVQKTTKRG